LLDRRFFDEAFQLELERANDTNGLLFLTLVDIDNLKMFNDNNGHAAGDMVIKRIARILDRAHHGDNYIVSRIGGDEFAILVSGMGAEETCQMAEGLRFTIDNDDLLSVGKVKASFGIAVFPQDGMTPEKIMRAADEQLYQSKNAGGNRVSYNGLK
jgi:diguanylate cyclase (GGDEF)-like protein